MSDQQMKWIIPPECQGQMVEVAYGDSYDGMAWRCTTDRNDGSVAYEVAEMSDCGCDGECNCWEPWNVEPSGYDWVPCAAPEKE